MRSAELQHEDLHLTCERWFLCSKIIRQLIISGFPSDSKAMQVVDLRICALLSLSTFSSISQCCGNFICSWFHYT